MTASADAAQTSARPQFPPPTLESVVVPGQPADKERVRVALGQIAEQDPLINVRQDDERQELYVSLYGEVQKEVIQTTLADDYWPGSAPPCRRLHRVVTTARLPTRPCRRRGSTASRGSCRG